MLCALNDETGAAVDWWFMYKLPKGVAAPGQGATCGNEYLYYDAGQAQPLRLSPNTLGSGPQGALFHTLQALFGAPGESVGWICYNDEYPADLRPGNWPSDSDWPPAVKPGSSGGKPEDHAHNGHCKGILAFDLADGSAFWLSHSTPKIPDLNAPGERSFFYPEDEWEYAQTFLCISLDGVGTAAAIAKVLAEQHEPQVFSCRIPAALSAAGEYAPLWTLAQGVVAPDYGPHYAPAGGPRPPADLSFSSKAGKPFRLLAKSGSWMKDLWLDWVEPTLGTDLRVETWRRLTASATLPEDNASGGAATEFGPDDFETDYKGTEYHHEFLDGDEQHVIDEVTTIDLSLLADSAGKALTGCAWSYTKDHAKWAVSEPVAERGDHAVDDQQGTDGDWICVADMNRMTSQEIRGGGAICFHEPALWRSLNDIERIDGAIT
ncbi:MAG: deoxyribonuclease II family protein [Sulfuricella sp.]|nr:deoxyribonuclease II family protein [Sulfuricella sp.]